MITRWPCRKYHDKMCQFASTERTSLNVSCIKEEIFFFWFVPDWKTNSDPTYNYPRVWRLSAIMCAQLRTPPETPWTISQHYPIGGLLIGPPWCRGKRYLSDSREFLQRVSLTCAPMVSCGVVCLYIKAALSWGDISCLLNAEVVTVPLRPSNRTLLF